jgi:hypothetical protein
MRYTQVALRILTASIIGVSLFSGTSLTAKVAGSFCIKQPTAQQQITYKIIAGAANTWGYDIYMDGKLAIHQASRPGMPGNTGFATQKQATAVAKLVVKKIQNGEMPPAVSAEEMKALKAI